MVTWIRKFHGLHRLSGKQKICEISILVNYPFRVTPSEKAAQSAAFFFSPFLFLTCSLLGLGGGAGLPAIRKQPFCLFFFFKKRICAILPSLFNEKVLLCIQEFDERRSCIPIGKLTAHILSRGGGGGGGGGRASVLPPASPNPTQHPVFQKHK